LVCQDLKKELRLDVLKKLALFPPGLDSLYMRMLEQILMSGDAKMCLQVLATTAVLYRPITVAELIALVEQLKDYVDDLKLVREIISLCGSFLTLQDDTVYFVHQSAKDFLFVKVFNNVFPEEIRFVHREMFIKSVSILHKMLHRDMYSLQAPGCPVEDVTLPLLDLLAASRYPCIFWIDHLCHSRQKTSAHNNDSLEDASIVDVFIRQKYLYWLEGLSLCKSVEKGVVSIDKLWSL
jgi:hypothetical protein